VRRHQPGSFAVAIDVPSTSVNLFSYKRFDIDVAKRFSIEWRPMPSSTRWAPEREPRR
jgi:hypothetical protein